MIASAIVRLPSVEMTFLQPCFLVSFLGVLFFPAALVAASSGGSEDSLVPRELKMVFDNCMARTSPGYCLQKKMLDFLDRALTKEQIPLAEGFSLSKTNDANHTETATARQSTGSIEEQIWSKLDRFFNTRSLSISLAEEGRGKKKKEHALYVVAMATALAVLIPLTLKGIALIAGKALLLAKLALVLAGLAALKHFTHHEESHRRVHIADDVHDAHTLAYGAYAPAHAAAV